MKLSDIFPPGFRQAVESLPEDERQDFIRLFNNIFMEEIQKEIDAEIIRKINEIATSKDKMEELPINREPVDRD